MCLEVFQLSVRGLTKPPEAALDLPSILDRSAYLSVTVLFILYLVQH